MEQRLVSPSYSPTLPAYEAEPDQAEPSETSTSPPLSPILWNPTSPGGWSDSTVPWSIDNEDWDDEEEFSTSPWPVNIFQDIEDIPTMGADYFGATLPREDEEEVVEAFVVESPIDFDQWSGTTHYVSDPEE